jgi:hypothetical protein
MEENKTEEKRKKTRNNKGKNKNKSDHPTERTNTLKDKDTDINVTVQCYDNYLPTSKRDDIVITGLRKHINTTNCFVKAVNRVVAVFS